MSDYHFVQKKNMSYILKNTESLDLFFRVVTNLKLKLRKYGRSKGQVKIFMFPNNQSRTEAILLLRTQTVSTDAKIVVSYFVGTVGRCPDIFFKDKLRKLDLYCRNNTPFSLQLRRALKCQVRESVSYYMACLSQ